MTCISHNGRLLPIETLDALQDLVFLFDQDGQLQYCNTYAEEITGYSTASIMSMNVFDLFEDADYKRIDDALRTARNDGSFSLTANLVMKDGTPLPFEVKGSTWHDESDGSVSYCGIGRDISGKVETEESLDLTRRWFSSIFQRASIGIAIVEATSQRVILTNPAFHETLGYTEQDAQALRLQDITHPDDVEKSRQAIEQLRQGEEETVRFEKRYLTRTGDTFWGRVTVSTVPRSEGPPRHLIAMFEDISETKRLQEAFQHSEERWKMLVESHPEPILVTVDGTIVYANEAAAELCGVDSSDAVLDRSLFEFVSDEDKAHLKENITHLRRGKATESSEYEIEGLDGKRRTVLAHSTPITYDGQPAAQSVVRDVTEQKEYEQRLKTAKEQAEEMDQLKSAVLANLNHEIRTPLTSIMGFAELLSEKVDSDSQRMVTMIQKSGRRLLDTLNGVLDFAKLEGGTIELEYESIDVVQQGRTVLEKFATPAAQKGLALDLDAPEQVRAQLDRGAFESILKHLLSNAIKFTNEGGITLSIQANDTEVALSIEDTGVGVDDHFLPHLFDEFKQESKGFHREYEGTGLGLTITKQLVHLLNGSIEVDSTKGMGSVFTVRFPRVPTEKPASPPAPHSREAPAETSQPSLLVVEDNQMSLKLLNRMLETDYRIETATGVDEALHKARAHQFDAFILDINLSERRTGVEILHELRRMPHYASTPVIACTAYALQEHKHLFQNAGFTEVISKPVTKNRLLNGLEHAFDAPSQSTDGASVNGEEIQIELPPLPTTMFEVVELLSRKEQSPDIEKLTSILKRDQVVSLWLLRHVNSAYYNLNNEITTVDRAIRYVGFRPVCNLVLTETLAQSYSDFEDEHAQGVYEHVMRTGLATASFAKALASRLDFDQPDLAYSAGLLCQLGRLLLLDKEGEQYANLWYDDKLEGDFIGAPPLGQEILYCSADYVTFGVEAGRQCDLANDILTAIRHHRQPTHAPRGERRLLTMIAALSLETATLLQAADDLDDPQLFAEAGSTNAFAALTDAQEMEPNDLMFFLQNKASEVRSFVDTIFHH